jgi:RimJ/RimL family protein N-acetyltransferase
MCVLFRQARLETNRLILRAIRPDDAVPIAERINDYEIARMLTRVPYPYGLGDAEDFFESYAAADPAFDRVFVIEHRASGPIGVLGFHEQPTTWSESGCALSPELGYWLARPHWGQGLASEAVEGALAWARDEWALKFVVAGHFADNPASGRVLDKAGFLYTGEVQQRFSVARGATAPTRMMVWMA